MQRIYAENREKFRGEEMSPYSKIPQNEEFYVKEFCHKSLYHFPMDFNGDAKECHENTALGNASLGTQHTAQSVAVSN